jgi:hypothetical protein
VPRRCFQSKQSGVVAILREERDRALTQRDTARVRRGQLRFERDAARRELAERKAQKCETCGMWAERKPGHAPDGFRGDWSVCRHLVEVRPALLETGRLYAVPTAPRFSCPDWRAKDGAPR